MELIDSFPDGAARAGVLARILVGICLGVPAAAPEVHLVVRVSKGLFFHDSVGERYTSPARLRRSFGSGFCGDDLRAKLIEDEQVVCIEREAGKI